MSRAFVKEPDGPDVFDDHPEKLISEHRNLVTPAGFEAIKSEVARSQSELAAAQGADDRGAISRAMRDLKYWSQRETTAEVQQAPRDSETVQFGSTVSLVRDDGRRQSYRIVGEDESDPANGAISYVAPLAQALMGKRVGDEVRAGAGSAEIVDIKR